MPSKQRSPDFGANVAQCLREKKHDILTIWENRIRQKLPATQGQSRYFLRDSLPAFLDNLADSLDSNRLEQRSVNETTDKIAEKHATQRTEIANYTLEQVQLEYSILRKVIFESLESDSVLSAQHRDIILDFIISGQTAAADEYMRIGNDKLKISEERLALALESAKMGTFDWEIPTNELIWSDTMKELFGFRSGEFTGQLDDFWSRVHPDDIDSVQTALNNTLKQRVDYITEFKVIWPDGSIHWLAGKGRAYFDENGSAIRVLGTSMDITDQKLFESSLRNSNIAIQHERAWYEMVLNSIPTPLFLIDTQDGAIFFQNEASRKLRVHIPKCISPDDESHYALDAKGNILAYDDWPRHRIIRGEKVDDFELHLHSNEGETPFLVDGRLLPSAHGRSAVGLLSYRDITVIKEAEKGLKVSEEKFRLLYESGLVGIVFGNIEGAMEEMNDQFLKLIGYSREEIRDKKISWVQLTPPEYRTLDEKAIREMKETGRCTPFEKPMIRKDGSWVWLMLTAMFVDSTRHEHIAIAIDVTDLKTAQEALRNSEKSLQIVAESVPQIIWAATPDAYITQFNQNWYDYTGYDHNQPIGTAWLEYIHPKDRERSLHTWADAQIAGKVFTVEHRVRRHDGEYRWFLSRARPLKNIQGQVTHWFGASTDINDQKRVQEALEEERELREQFVNTLSHDLRNPLTAAKMSAELIAHDASNPKMIKQWTQMVIGNLSRADKMIADLLDANRVRAGQGLPVEMDMCDIAAITDQVISELNSIYGNRVHGDHPKSVIGFWSCKDIYRLLENLVINGLKYGDPNFPVSVRILEKDSIVTLSVHNYGKPIPKSELKNLFNPFVRSRTADLSRKKGWGLGLTLVRGVTEAHSGHIEVESNSDAGTTFTVILPKDPRQQSAA